MIAVPNYVVAKYSAYLKSILKGHRLCFSFTPQNPKQISPRASDGPYLPPFLCYLALAGHSVFSRKTQKMDSIALKTTMIYSHCVPVRTVKEPKSPLDF